MDSQSPGTGSGCTVNSLGGNVCIRIPTDSSDPKSITTHVSVHMPTDFSSPPVASSPLVHSPVRNGNRFSKNSSSKRKSAKSAKCKGVSPKSRNSKTVGMAALDSNFRAKGFSKKVRELLAASWRKGTKRDYCSKFTKFSSWCSERQKDPYSATLNDCAEFFDRSFS